jgi:hypothetical protein
LSTGWEIKIEMLDALSRYSEYHPKRGSMAEDNKNLPITTVLCPKDFVPYDSKYNDSGIPIISAA